MASRAVDVLVRLKADIARAKKEIKGAFGAIKKSADAVGDAVFNVQTLLSVLGAGAVVTKLVKDFADFDDVMRSVKAITGATASEFDLLTNRAKEMGKESRYTAAQSADAMKYMSMAGMNVNEVYSGLPGVLQLAAAGAMDLGTAADITTNVLSGMQLEIKDLSDVNDTLAYTANNANTNIQELGEAFRIAGPAAAGSNIDIKETAAILGAMADNGIKGANAGHNFKRMALAIQAPTNKAKDALKELNISLKDSDGNMRSLTDILSDLGDANVNLVQATDIFGRFTSTAAVAASASAASVRELDAGLRDLGEAGSYVKKVADTMEEDLGGAIRKLISMWESFRLVIGQALSPQAIEFVTFLRERLEAAQVVIEEMVASGDFQKLSTAVVGAMKDSVDAIGTLLVYLKDAAVLLSPFIESFIKLAPAMVAVAAAAKLLGISMGVVQSIAGTSMLIYLKHVQTASTYTNLLNVAAGGLANTLTIIGAAGAAAFVGWKIGEVINDTHLLGLTTKTVGETVQDIYAKIFGPTVSDEAIENIGRIISKFEEFKDISLPDTLAEKSVADLEQYNKEVNKAIVYWNGFASQQEMLADRAYEEGRFEDQKNHNDAIEAARKRVVELQGAQEKLTAAINAGVAAQESELQGLKDAAALQNKLTQERIAGKSEEAKGIKTLMEERIKAAEEAYSQEKSTLEEFLAEKTAAEEEAEGKIQQIRMEGAENVASLGKEMLAAVKERTDEEIRVIQERVKAGVITEAQGAQQITAVRETAAKDRKDIETKYINAVETEKKAIREKALAEYIEGLGEETKAQEQELKKQLAAIEQAEAEGLKTKVEAEQAKLKVIDDHYAAVLERANENLRGIVSIYGSESEEFQKAKEVQAELDVKYAEQRADAVQSIAKAQEKAEKERLRILEDSYKEAQSIYESEASAKEREMEKAFAKTDRLLKEEVISVQEAALEKARAEESFVRWKVEQLELATKQAADAYGRESAAYRKAIEEKKAAQHELSLAQEKTKEAIEGLTKDENDLADAAEDTGEKGKEAGDKIKEANDAAGESVRKLTYDARATGEELDNIIKKADEFKVKFGVPYMIHLEADEAINTMDELEKMATHLQKNLMNAVSLGDMGSGTVGATYESLKKVKEIQEEFKKVSAAVKEVGIEMDMTNLTIAEAKEKVVELAEAAYDDMASSHEAAMLKIQEQESMGIVSAQEANTQRQQVDEEYYQGRIQKAEDAIRAVGEVFGRESAEYQEALDLKKEAESEFTQYRIERAEEAAARKREIEEAEANLYAARLENQKAQIDALEQQGTITAQEASDLRKEIAEGEAQTRIDAATRAVAEAKATYGEESAEYLNAVAAKEEATAKLTQFQIAQAEEAAKAQQEIAEANKEVYAAQIATQIAAIQDLETRGVITASEASEQRKQIAIEEAKLKVAMATEAMEEAKTAYGEESAEFLRASAEKESALATLQTAFNKMNESVRERIQAWEEFGSQLSETGESIQALAADMSNMGAEDAVSDLSSLREEMGNLEKSIVDVRNEFKTGTIESAQEMADGVVESYQDIYDRAKETLDDLKDQWEEYADKVLEIQGKIDALNQSTEEKLREMKRETMSELEAWNDRRMEYEETYAAAVKAASEGLYEQAEELFDRAMDISAGLQEEIKDADGEVVKSLEENTAAAMAMFEKASSAASESLSDWQGNLKDQQKEVRGEIQKTVEGLLSMADTIEQIKKRPFNLTFWGTASPTRPLMETLTGIGVKFDELRMQTAEPMKADIDFVGADELGTIRDNIRSVFTEAEEGFRRLQKEKDAFNSDSGGSSGGSGDNELSFYRYARGGVVPGSGGVDTVPAWLTPGEGVLTPWATRALGYGALRALNQKNRGVAEAIRSALSGVYSRAQRFADGGIVMPDSLQSIATGGQNNVNVNLSGLDSLGRIDIADPKTGTSVPVITEKSMRKMLERIIRRDSMMGSA